MIPLVDDYLQLFIAEKLKWLKDNPEVIEHIFHTGKRETLTKLKDFIANRRIKVVIGYPKDQTSLPCYVITLAPEQEQPVGLGDDSETFDDYDLGIGGDDATDVEKTVEEKLTEFLAATYMNSNYRIECWSDNGDLTSYMYVILKWCLWTSRQTMLNMGWVNIRLSGTDLEPVPDYMPVFIYRRSAQVAITYENLYYEEIDSLGHYLEVLKKPDVYHEDDDGNIVDEDGNIVIPAAQAWIIRAHYYQKSVGDVITESTSTTVIESIIQGTTNSGQYISGGLKSSLVDKLPETGESNTLYLLVSKNEDGEDIYRSFLWVNGQYKPIVGVTDDDLSEYATVVVVDQKDTETLGKAVDYTDNKQYNPEDVGVTVLGGNSTNNIFNDIFNE